MTAWMKSWLVAIAVSATVLATYELSCRHRGFVPSIESTGDVWIAHMQAGTRGRAVLLGNSRCQAALRPEGLAELFGEPPAQLCIVNVNPLDVLTYLVDETEFSGTAIVDIVPGIAFVRAEDDDGWPVLARQLEDRPLYAGFEARITMALQSRLSMLIRPASPLVALRGLRGLNPAVMNHQVEAVRADGAYIPVGDPEVTRHMWPDGVPWPKSIKEDYDHRLSDTELAELCTRTRATVKALERRGGHVIFLRLPVTGSTRDAEDHYFPRAMYWDRLLRETGAPGIYYADQAALQGFEQPDESHVAMWLAPEFTRRLVVYLAPLVAASPR